MSKFCVSLTHAKNDPDKATVAFVIANAAVASDKVIRVTDGRQLLGVVDRLQILEAMVESGER